MQKNTEIIGLAKPHSIKKFELIEKYVKTWAQKLLNTPQCKRIVFIDCMCNSGEYFDSQQQCVLGTPVRVAKILNNCAYQYEDKKIDLYFNDIEIKKIDHIKDVLTTQKLHSHKNYQLHFECMDRSKFLRSI